MFAIGYFASLLIGVALGLIGAGGSILTLPVLVYLFHINAITATGYSLFIVGVTSTVGAYQRTLTQEVNFSSIVSFGIPSIASIMLTRIWILPHLPKSIALGNAVQLPMEQVLLLSFSALMLYAAYRMARPVNRATTGTTEPKTLVWIVYGIMVGIISGLVGVGGGFLLIPMLTIYGRLEMNEAIGTSLWIIALNALIGFLTTPNAFDVNWVLLLSITSAALVGLWLGLRLTQYVNTSLLRRLFIAIILLIAISMVAEEVIKIIGW